jgi:hypothetical protein
MAYRRRGYRVRRRSYSSRPRRRIKRRSYRRVRASRGPRHSLAIGYRL